jgi:hypothetical protein
MDVEYTGNFGKKYKEWFIMQYKSINKPFPPTDNKQAKEIIEKVKNMDLKYSSINRILAYRVMAYDIQLSIVNIMCTTCKIIDIKSKDSVIYGFIFSEAISKEIPIYASDLVNKDIMHRFFSAGPSFLSKDGEYRAGFTNFNSLTLCRKHFPDIWNDIEQYLASNLYKRGLRLVYETIYPNEEYRKYIENMDYSMVNNRLNMALYIIAWFKAARRMYFDSLELHTNEKYIKLILKEKTADMAFMKKLMNKYTMDKIDEFREICGTYYTEPVYNENIDVKVGQKIIPLNLAEVQNPFNIYYGPWKEYLVSQTVSQLVINNISPSFPLINRWIYIKNTKKGLFDNPVQYDKMERSDIAKEIATLLLQAQSYTFSETDKHMFKPIMPKEAITSWLSNKFQILYDKIQDPIEYSKEDLIMADAALCIFSEYVGRTFIDMLTLCGTSDYYNEYLGFPLGKGIEYFIKFIFDICYSLYCLNTKLGIIHTDMHLNNVTIHHNQQLYLKEIAKINNPQVLYVLGNEPEHQFLMPTHGYYANIIDFSRCVIHPEKISIFKDPSLPKIYEVTDDPDKFQTNQIDYLVRVYLHEFPTFYSKKDELTVLFKKQFNSCFKLFSVLDIFIFTRKIQLVYDSTNLPKIHQKGVELLNQINQISEIYLTTEMNKLLADPINYAKEIENQQWPLLSIIIQCFSKYNTNNKEIGVIVDMFNYNNDMKYAIDTYDNFPPYLKKYEPKHLKQSKIDKVQKKNKDKNQTQKKGTKTEIKQEKAFKKMEETIINNIHTWEVNRLKRMKMIDYIAKRHKEKYL